jgi:Zn-dependent hydrolases, including glyoxylases
MTTKENSSSLLRKICDQPELYCVDIPLPNNPLKNLNCYMLRSNGKLLVIDTGFRIPETAEVLLAALAELGVSFQDTTLFLTHLHSDHTGLADLFAEKGCTIYMSSIDYEMFKLTRSKRDHFLTYHKEGFPMEELLEQQKVNPAAVFAPLSIFPVTAFDDGFRFHIGEVEFEAVHTPGHTPGHCCLYIPAFEIMFLGDHVLFDITPNITVWPTVENSLQNYLDSLKKIEKYPITLPLPAHRGNDMDVYQRISDIQIHHVRRLENTLDIIGKYSDLTSYEIASHMTWSMRGKDWTEFPLHQKWFAVGETLSHLDLLLLEGKIEKHLDNEMFRYRLI